LTVRADAVAMGRVQDFVAAFATTHGLETAEMARIAILLEELLTNLVKYGYPTRTEPGMADIGLELDGSRLTIEFADDGRAFDPLAQPAPDLDLSHEDRSPGGLGIHILKALTAEARYSRIDDRNVIRLTRRVSLIGS
jgi:anti-sigma regulatory factor (Ser/Thr protein kinase)